MRQLGALCFLSVAALGGQAWLSTSKPTIPRPHSLGANVMDFGARGDGMVDDTAAIQRAIDSWPDGGPVLLPAGAYRITSTLKLKASTQLRGLSMHTTTIDARSLVNSAAIWGPGNSAGVEVSNLKLLGPFNPQEGSIGIYPGHFPWAVRLERIYVMGFWDGIVLSWAVEATLTEVFVTLPRHVALDLRGVAVMHASNCLFANSMGFGYLPANVRMNNWTHHVMITSSLIDEAFGNAASVLALQATDITIQRTLIYSAPGKWGVRLGDGVNDPQRFVLDGVYVRPFDKNVQAWNLELRGSGHVLRDVTSLTPNGGGDINDLTTDTLYMNVNGTCSGCK